MGIFWFFNVYVLSLFVEEKQKGKGGRHEKGY